MQTSTILTILSAIVALGGAVSTPLLEQVFPGHGAYVAGIIALAGLVAGVVINALTKQTQGTPATSVALNPKTGNIDVAHPDGTPTGATVVTTTSTEPIVAPQKGTQ